MIVQIIKKRKRPTEEATPPQLPSPFSLTPPFGGMDWLIANESVSAWLDSICTGYAARFGPAFTSIGASRMCEVVSWLAMLQEDGYSKLRSSMLTSRPHAEAAVEHALKQLRAYAAAVDTSLSSSSSSQQLL